MAVGAFPFDSAGGSGRTSNFLRRWKTSWPYLATVAATYEMAAKLARKAGIAIEDSTVRALVQRLGAPQALAMLTDGVDLRGAKMRPWYEREE